MADSGLKYACCITAELKLCLIQQEVAQRHAIAECYFVAMVTWTSVSIAAELRSGNLQHSDPTLSSVAKLCLQKWRQLLVSTGR